MKKLFVFIVLLLIGIFSFSQTNVEPCFFDTYQRTHKQSISTSEKIISKAILDGKQKLLNHNPNLKTIPDRKSVV